LSTKSKCLNFSCVKISTLYWTWQQMRRMAVTTSHTKPGRHGREKLMHSTLKQKEPLCATHACACAHARMCTHTQNISSISDNNNTMRRKTTTTMKMTTTTTMMMTSSSFPSSSFMYVIRTMHCENIYSLYCFCLMPTCFGHSF
jgi:hypothetical protein